MAAKRDTAVQNQTIFQDVFRRADKNDDGALSWAEFKAFFSDGVSSNEDLERLFKEIDTHGTNNLDVGELCEFFTQHLGPFSEIFKGLEGVGAAVTRTLVDCHPRYPKSSVTEQFAMRFLLRETIRQFGYVQQHLETASESIDEEEVRKRPSVEAEVQPAIGSKNRRILRNLRSYEQQTSFQGPQQIEREVDRLAELIDKLEGKVCFSVVEEQIAEHQKDDKIELVCRKFAVDASKMSDFKAFLRSYSTDTKKSEHCLGLSICLYSDCASCHLYEIWRNKVELSRHLVSAGFKNFQRQLIDTLVQPEDFSSMTLPGSWWPKK
eukprot:Seg2114.4 transcript_id=Seg2114.4/GoldUCD/mRNA.D3Y31 product="N-terminal EF-hand calcium-binding protein 1" protein_id=Seg2114.4/GoldUCD/D3Y31